MDAENNGVGRYLLLNRVADEISARFRRGERVALVEYLERHPELADELRELFPALSQVESANKDCETGPPLAAPAAGEETPPLERLGDYRIVRLVGQGGMGTVYEAEQVSLGRRVALKVLPARLLASASYRARFEREARAAGRLHHTNIVPVYGVGEHEGTPYYAMQFIEGHGLDAVLRELQHLRCNDPSPAPAPAGPSAGRPRDMARSLLSGDFGPARGGEATVAAPEPLAGPPPAGPAIPGSTASLSSSSVLLPGPGGAALSSRTRRLTYWQSVARVGLQVADALEHAHRQGVLHRDVKPSNLLLDPAGMVWVTDFGLAKMDGEDDLTATGDVLGTLRYMPPESFRGKADRRSDVYSLGLTLFELLALRPAHDAPDRAQLLRQVEAGQVPRLGALNPAVPRDLATVVHKAVEPDPADRYQSAGELAEDLHRILADEPVKARRLSPPELLARWARRNRAVAASLAAVAALLLALTVGALVAAGYFRRLAGENATLVQDKEKERTAAVQAQDLAQKSREELRANLYRAEMGLAAQAATAPAGIARVDELLANWRSGPADPRGWEWYDLHGLGAGSLLTLRGQPEESAVAWSPDGTRLALAGRDATVRVWDAATGKETLALRGYGQAVMAVAWGPDGTRLAAGGFGGFVQVWDTADGTSRYTLTGPLHPWRVRSLAWSPDGTRLASGSDDPIVRVWDAPGAKREAGGRNEPGGLLRGLLAGGLRGHTEAVTAVAWSPDSTRLASSSFDGSIRVWEPDRGAEEFQLHGHHQRVNAVAWSPDGRRLVSAGSDETVRVWDAALRREVHRLSGHVAEVVSVAWGPDGRRLASAGRDHTVRVWDPEAGREVLTLRGHTGPVQAVAWSPDGARLASSAADESLRVWSLSAGPTPQALRGHVGGVLALAWSPDGRRLASAAADSTVRVWDPRTGCQTQELRDPTNWVRSVAWSPDGHRLAWCSDRTVRLGDLTTGRDPLALAVSPGDLLAVAWSPDGRRLAWSGWDRILRIGDAAGGGEPLVLRGHTHGVIGLAWSPKGDRLASAGGGADSTLRVWNPTTGRLLLTLLGHTSGLEAVAWSPDGTRLASCGDDHTVRVWDAATGQPLRTLRGHTNAVRSVAWSPDGTRLASCGNDHTVRLWDPEVGREILAFREHADHVTAVAWSPDGLRLASAGDDRTILIHDATPGLVAERSDRLLPELERRLALRPGSARDRRLRGEGLARKGDWDRAAADVRQALAAGAAGPSTWFSGGWWLAGPFHDGAEEPDAQPDPLRPLPPLPDGRDRAWLPAATTADGCLDLRGCLPPGEGCGYAVSRVWSPAEQQVTARLEASGAVRFWLNGRLIHETAQSHSPGQSNEIGLVLPAGWSTLAFRVAAGGTGHGLRVWLSGESERAWERLRDLLAHERWQEAEAALGQAAREHPEVAAWLNESAGRAAQCQAVRLRGPGQREAARLARACFGRLSAARPDDPEAAGRLADLLWDELRDGSWTVLRPVQATSAGKATLTTLPDHAVQASGENPPTDTYTVVAATERTGITAVRLEVLPDAALPGNGPGRAVNGNLTLSEFKLTLAPENNPSAVKPVVFKRAGADFTQEGYPVASTIDGSRDKGWAIWPAFGQLHVATFETSEALDCPPGTRLTFTLEQRFGSSHNIGKFRLSATTSPYPVLAQLWQARAGKASAGGWTRLGAAHVFRGEWAAARDALRKASDGPDGGTADDELLLSLACDHLDRPDESRRAFVRAVERMRWAVADEGLLEMAIGAASGRIARDPGDALAWVQRASWNAATGRTAQAAADRGAAERAAGSNEPSK